MSTAELPERLALKTLVEACLVLEEGEASAKDIEVGMMMGAGILPGPFARADEQGLDTLLESLERAHAEWGDSFAPPVILRRLVAQGRLGKKSGQGFFAYPRPDETRETVALETRGDVGILWLDRPPANALSPELIGELAELWGSVDGKLRAVVFASSNIFTFSAGADIKAFTKMDPAQGRELIDAAHALFRSFERSSTATIAAVNSIAFGGGCELAMACDFRLAAESASFGQPEIDLGIIPGFGGTQRLPRLVGEAKALEMNLTAAPVDAYEAWRVGLANRVVPDHELLDTALLLARDLAGQAPLAVEQIKRVSGAGDLDQGIEAEKDAFATIFGTADAKEGIEAFLGKRQAKFEGKVGPAAELAGLLRSARSAVVLTGAGISVPSGIPDFRSPGTGVWANVDPMEVAHIDVFRRDPDRFWHFYGARFASLREVEPNPAHAAVAELERRGVIDGVITQNIDRLHRAAGSREVVEVHGSIEWSRCPVCGARFELERVVDMLEGAAGAPEGTTCVSPLKPEVVLFGEMLPMEAIARAEQLAAGADLMICIGSSLVVHPVAGLPELTLAAGGKLAVITESETPYDDRATVRLGGDVVDELESVLAAL